MKKTKIILLLILAFNLLLRLPALFDPVSYGDECIYLTLGNALRKGLVFYRDIHDNKPPLLYLIAALSWGKLFWFRLFVLIGNSLNIWLVYLIGKLIIVDKNKEKAGLLAALLFALFSFFPEGRIANGEIFMIIPATLGYYLVLKTYKLKKNLQCKKNDNLWILIGLCFSLAFLIKVPVAFDFFGLLLAVFVFEKKKLSELKLILKDKRFKLIILSFCMPIFASIIYYSVWGAFVPYVRSALLQNIGYLSSWGNSSTGLYLRTFVIFIIAGCLYLWRQKLGFYVSSLALLTLFGLFGVFLSQRPYPHYLLEISPWLALLLATVFFQKIKSQFIVTLLLILLLILGFKTYHFWWYPQLPYYRNFFQFTLGKINRQDYFNFFGKKTLEDYEIAKYVKLYSEPQDRVFIWGDGACIYALTDRLPPGRYTVNYHIYDFNGFQETLSAIEKKAPKIIVLLEPLDPKISSLDNILQSHYYFLEKINNASLFKRLPNR